MPADHFGERIAALYDAHSQNMFAPAAVDPPFTSESTCHVPVWQKQD